MTKREKQEREAAAVEKLKQYLKPGGKVWIIVHDVARSGMSRTMSVYALEVNEKKGEIQPYWLTRLVADALGLQMNDRDHLRVSGCGMDMTFWLQEEISGKLGFSLRRETL